MFGSSMLDVALGIVFVFLLLSIFATAINEIILSKINLRGKFLLQGIQALLADEPSATTTPPALDASGQPVPTTAIGLAEMVYDHGQVCGLYKGDFKTAQKKGDLPSYIPSRNFALALLSSLDPDFGVVGPPVAMLAPVAPQANAPAGAASTTATTATAAVQNIVTISDDFKAAAQKLTAYPATAKVGKSLVSMIAMAGNDANKLQKAVEDWYNSGMDRVSGWYKYRTQWVLFAIGLVMAIALNADTIGIVRQLSKDPTLRQSIVAAAQNAKAPTQPGDPAFPSQVTTASNSFKTITTLGIPLGWPNGAPAVTNILYEKPHTLAPWKALFLTGRSYEKLLGWLLTAIAISLGAPFWFDALNRIMVIRSTVKPTEKSKDEASKS